MTGYFARMRIDIITLFPEICRAPLNESMMKRAQENGALDLHIHNLRGWTSDKHHVVDDAPFGGGQGMVMKPEPIFAAVEDLQKTPNANVQRPTSNYRRRKSFLCRRRDDGLINKSRENSRKINISSSFAVTTKEWITA